MAEIGAARVGDGEERVGVALVNDARVVELVAAKTRPFGAERARSEQSRDAVPEMSAAIGKARRERQQPGHAMRLALTVGQRFAQDHVATAFAKNRAARVSSSTQPAEEVRRTR